MPGVSLWVAPLPSEEQPESRLGPRVPQVHSPQHLSPRPSPPLNSKPASPVLGMEPVCSGRGLVAQLVRVSSQYAKVPGRIPGQGTYKTEPINASVSGTPSRCLSLSLPQNQYILKREKSVFLKNVFRKSKIKTLKDLFETTEVIAPPPY